MRPDARRTDAAGLRLLVRGSVQGVGFRPWLWRQARALGLAGTVRNVPGGVLIEAFGAADGLAALAVRLQRPTLAGAIVEALESETIPVPEAAPCGFEIVDSSSVRGEAAALPLVPDRPTCVACLQELADRSSRRYRYPFIACAACGPRYTMSRGLPYDRDRTAMADFPPCAACAAEYHDPADRRFHAEATACPACGPSLRLLSPGGEVLARQDEALIRAVERLRSGGLVAIQGIGGFHLACDASDERAVRLVRERKRRPGKPLAVMLRTPAEAEKHALVSAEERALLVSDARPIVLLRRRDDSSLAPSLAPGSPMVGLLLAYAPLHELLLEGFGGPLVMTSANRSGEPIPHRLAASPGSLGGLSDALLAHDREIVTPCDDSVALQAPTGPVLLRRSRGYVPRPIRLARPLRGTLLACGGHWSNTVCVARGEHAWLSAHVGDLDSPESVERFERTVERWLGWLGVAPERVGHDLHPGYESTRFARTRWADRALGVQHHHAHLAAVLGEHGVEGPALGLVWDGTGYGEDGSAWGGELLFGDAASVRRLATFRPLILAGGERAIREPWRLALALLEDAFEGSPPLEALALFRRVDASACEQIRALLASQGQELWPRAHGVGRYFDAVGALLLARPAIAFQGELAQAVNFLCSREGTVAYPFQLERRAEPWQLDLRPAIRRLVEDLTGGVTPEEIAARFHRTLVVAGAALVREGIVEIGGDVPVALAGGCFQNPILLAGLERELGTALEPEPGGDARVLRPVQLPSGDGGLAFGQALVVDARDRAREGG
jgi:hydrogenase maturation protein HypF